MTIFANAARGKFLTQALVTAGLTEEAIASAQAAGTVDFIGELGDPQMVALAASYGAAFDAAGIKLSATATPTALLQAHIEAREAAARKAGEEAATLRAASELAARGHAPVATAPGAAADSAQKKPGEGLTGLAKVTAIFQAEQVAARQN